MTVQEIVGILDRSGSMRGKEHDTVGGINTMISEVKKGKTKDDTIRVSIKLFDNEEIMKWRSLNIDDVDDFPVEDFIPRGSTALLDALGNSLKYFMEKKLMDPTAYDSCLLYVATDGLENSSHLYNRVLIKELINAGKEKYNITVVYLGANQDAILEASNLGINAAQAINYSENEDCTQAVFRSVGRVASDARTNRNAGFNEPERHASQIN